MTTIENDTSRTLQAVWASLLVCLAATIGCGEGSSAKPAASRVSAKTVDEIRHIAAMLLGVDPSKINAETSLADLGADELDLVELLIHLEDHFGVSIPDDLVNRAMGTDDFQQGIKNMTIAKFASIVDGQNQNHQRDSLQLPNDSGQVNEIKSQATSAPNVSLGDVTPGAKNVNCLSENPCSS